MWYKHGVFNVIILLMCIYCEDSQVIPCDSTSFVLYHCNDGITCITRIDFCNRVAYCPDGSDEFLFNETMQGELGIKCQYKGTRSKIIDKHCHLPNRYLCDHELDCVGGQDECNCPHSFECGDGDCAIKATFCDGFKHCPNGRDEEKYNRTSMIGFQCPVTSMHETNNCVLPDQYICDGESDCDNGIDECFCDFSAGQKMGIYLNTSYSNDKCFRCLDGSLIILGIQVCDGKINCQDFSDECLCTNKKGYKMPSICGAVCNRTDGKCEGGITCQSNGLNKTKIYLPYGSICDNIVDCADGIDEEFCVDSDQLFQCFDNKTKIKKSLFCNGPSDCPDNSDELHCNELTDYVCHYRHTGNVTYFGDPDGIQKASIHKGFTIKSHLPVFASRCDGIPTCAGADDECYATECQDSKPEFCRFINGPDTGFRCPVSKSHIVGKQICDGKPTCNDTAPEFSDDELYCPNRFYCKNLGATRRPIHIPMSAHCNGIQECDDQSDEMNCSASTHFYCEDGGSKLFVQRYEVCDGTHDCLEGSDECQDCDKSPFSSDIKLISSRGLVVVLWMIGLVAVIGNGLVIIYQLKKLIHPDASQTIVGKTNRILVLNLSISDILVGIYLISLGIKDATVEEYCLFDKEWRSSTTCSVLGALALIGTEASVFILAIMTAYRFYLANRPFQAQKIIVLKIAIAVAWCCSLLLALIPFAESMSDYFLSCVWYRKNEFFGHICRSELMLFAKELVKRGGASNKFKDALSNGYTWHNMFAAVRVLNSSYVPEQYFGYYSAHSVCLPRLFPNRNEDTPWEYSLFIILLNFWAFIFILISYIHIYRQTTRDTSAHRNISDDRIAAFQRKVTRIVMTDFCCWMPICIMAFIKVSGIQISDVAYSFTAITLLPINAAMNPFLYSDILDWSWEKMLPVRIWFRGSVCNVCKTHLHSENHRNENIDLGDTRQICTVNTIDLK